jgi:hypothetical protein
MGVEERASFCREGFTSARLLCYVHALRWGTEVRAMKLYRVNKLAKAGGVVIKKKHILANSDNQAVEQAADSSDCPVCEVLRDGERVGQIL